VQAYLAAGEGHLLLLLQLLVWIGSKFIEVMRQQAASSSGGSSASAGVQPAARLKASAHPLTQPQQLLLAGVTLHTRARC
jgi:hypothetical protein